MLQAKFRRPTNLENRIIELAKQNNLPYKYTDNSVFGIGGKYPDFTNKNQKIVIEIADKEVKKFRKGYS
jgi:hypothetical protein